MFLWKKYDIITSRRLLHNLVPEGRGNMRYEFTDDDRKNERNRLYLEEDDVLLDGNYIEGDGKHFVLFSDAVVEGEKYHDFETEFETADGEKTDTAADILGAEWLWYDFKC